jgi:hypothetical protein
MRQASPSTATQTRAVAWQRPLSHAASSSQSAPEGRAGTTGIAASGDTTEASTGVMGASPQPSQHAPASHEATRNER